MNTTPTVNFCRTPRTHDHSVAFAVDLLVDARRDMHVLKRALNNPNLSPVERTATERRHDAACQRVTSRRFALDSAIDAAEEA